MDCLQTLLVARINSLGDQQRDIGFYAIARALGSRLDEDCAGIVQ